MPLPDSILTNPTMNMMPTTTPTQPEAYSCHDTDISPDDADATAVVALCVLVMVFVMGVVVGAVLL
jgi:hypothetical protein